MSKTTLTLENVDVFQIIDALESRAVAYEKTATFLKGDLEREILGIEDPEARDLAALDALFVPEECRDAEESEEIARHFRDILEKINRQFSS